MKHNVYFEGKVQSLSIDEREGQATVGVIAPGVFTFPTASKEIMTVIAGALRVKLPGADWREYPAGETFVVPPKSSFDVEAKADVAYICRYR
jgi:uncharacterized protein YaiE (UPF0345 family)